MEILFVNGIHTRSNFHYTKYK